MIGREEDRYCSVIKQIIPETECYETVNGCIDTIVYKSTHMPYQQVKEICQNHPYSNMD